MKRRTAAAVLTLLAAASLCFGQKTEDAAQPTAEGGTRGERRAPYVSTPPEVVEAMLKAAKVTKDDIVYDLGCGDGRIVIMAALKYGARGVGIDIDPALVREAQENARKAGVADRVQFIQGDLFKSDLREATVVTLYLMASVNLELRPKLLRELKPGTRVVSHAFDMGDWKPQRAFEVNSGRAWGKVYFWVIPEGEPAKD